MTDPADSFLDRVISAHGGRDLWNRLDHLDAVLSARGFLFAAKHRPRLRHVSVRASCREPSFIFHGFPAPGMAGEFTGEEVRIRDAGGSVVMQRKQPRTAFGSLRRTFWWDDLDFLYFAGYATWNYLITPFIFLRPGFSFEYLGERRAGEGVFTCLRVMFPPGVPSHCRVQTFYFDRDLLLRRLDYTAEVVGGWAHAAHFCDEYRNFAGLMVPTRRRVYPTIRGRVVRLPVLVHIDLHELQPRQGE